MIKINIKKKTPYFWKGVYRSYEDISGLSNSYNDDSLVAGTENYTKRALENLEPKEEHSLLPLLASIVSRDNNGKIGIVDFGGGMGIGYIYLKDMLLKCNKIDYHIIELENVCRRGVAIFNGNGQIHFHTSFPHDLADIDIIYINSALQYVADYKHILEGLCSYRPRYILLARLAAGDIPTYVSVQRNLPGLKVPHWFLNINEVIRLISDSGYRLIYKGRLQREYNMDNFEERYRLKHHSTLLFSKKS